MDRDRRSRLYELQRSPDAAWGAAAAADFGRGRFGRSGGERWAEPVAGGLIRRPGRAGVDAPPCVAAAPREGAVAGLATAS